MPTLTRSKSRPKFKTSVGPVINYLTIWPQYVVHNLYQLKKCSRHQLPKHITHNTSHHTTTSNSRRRHKQCPPSRHQTMTTTSMPRATCPCLTLRHWPGPYRTGRLAMSAHRQRGDRGIAAAATERWRHGPILRRGVRGWERHSLCRTGRASSPHAGP